MNLEDEVRELKDKVKTLEDKQAYLTGIIQMMAWGYIKWGNDGFQIVGDRLKAIDCPEIGGTVINANSDSYEDNSIFKMSARWNGNELSLYQLKRARGFDHKYGPEVGMHQWSCNIGGGSGDRNMFDNMFLLPDLLYLKVPIYAPEFIGHKSGSTPTPAPKDNYAVGLVPAGREVSVELQTTEGEALPAIIVYDIRPLKEGKGAIPIGRVRIEPL